MEQDPSPDTLIETMKTVLKLVVAVAVLNAVVRGADAAWNYYQIKDAAQRTLLFGSSSTSAQLKDQILATARDLNVPLQPEGLTVRRQGGRRVAEGRYTKPIEFFPNYPYPMSFSFMVESVTVGTPPPDEEDIAR
jgi:hypothetical protein